LERISALAAYLFNGILVLIFRIIPPSQRAKKKKGVLTLFSARQKDFDSR
jgi:hypothetical protein